MIEEKTEEDTIEEEEKVLFVNLEEKTWRRKELNIRSRSESIEEMYPKNTKTSTIEFLIRWYLKNC